MGRETRSPVLEVIGSRSFTKRRQRDFPLPWGERGKGASECEGFPFSNSGLTDPPGPAFTHWKRRGTGNFYPAQGLLRKTAHS